MEAPSKSANRTASYQNIPQHEDELAKELVADSKLVQLPPSTPAQTEFDHAGSRSGNFALEESRRDSADIVATLRERNSHLESTLRETESNIKRIRRALIARAEAEFARFRSDSESEIATLRRRSIDLEAALAHARRATRMRFYFVRLRWDERLVSRSGLFDEACTGTITQRARPVELRLGTI